MKFSSVHRFIHLRLKILAVMFCLNCFPMNWLLSSLSSRLFLLQHLGNCINLLLELNGPLWACGCWSPERRLSGTVVVGPQEALRLFPALGFWHLCPKSPQQLRLTFYFWRTSTGNNNQLSIIFCESLRQPWPTAQRRTSHTWCWNFCSMLPGFGRSIVDLYWKFSFKLCVHIYKSA